MVIISYYYPSSCYTVFFENLPDLSRLKFLPTTFEYISSNLKFPIKTCGFYKINEINPRKIHGNNCYIFINPVFISYAFAAVNDIAKNDLFYKTKCINIILYKMSAI